METTITKPTINRTSFSIANILENKMCPAPPLAHSHPQGNAHFQLQTKAINTSAPIPSSSTTTTTTITTTHTNHTNSNAQPLQSRVGEPLPPTITNPMHTTAFTTLPPEAQYAFKNFLLKGGGHHDTVNGPLLSSPAALRFEPVYDPASLIYQQMLNMQKSSALFMPHFQAAAAAAAVSPTGYCEQYNPFLECEDALYHSAEISVTLEPPVTAVQTNNAH
ncbi:unnamed protein product [Ceratitis capitata]|uniref:(Mediterranean fruit fly) hypothetical protein n=1 Tax=Ceratitis capitata TaxID=7213 RepID=A0A811TWD9_CERCA|nr:unnamed protein product [Ceratitis capitata]